VRRLQQLGMDDMSRFDFAGPNEPDRHGATLDDMVARAVQIADELKSTGVANKVWGPTWSHPSGDYLTFAQRVGRDRLGGIDWHSYPGGASSDGRGVLAVLKDVDAHHAAVGTARERLARHGLPQQVNVDEINWTWDENHRDLLFTAANTVMLALAYCTILAAGGRVMAYATQNGALSVMADSYENCGRDRSTPMPAYWGIAALTGAGMPGSSRLFPHFHDTFYPVEESGMSGVRTFAVNNEANGINVIAINTSESEMSTHQVTFPARRGSYHLFQSRRDAPFEPPERVRRAVTFADSIQLVLPPMTVSILSCTLDHPRATPHHTAEEQ
jgi:hypothetical protein